MIASGSEARASAGSRLAAESQRDRSLFEHVPGFVIIVGGHDHVVEFVNREHRRLFDSGSWLGKPIRAARTGVTGQGLFDLLDRVYATGRTHKELKTAVRHRPDEDGDEATLHADVTYAPVFDGEGCTTGVFCQGFDLTDRAEAASESMSMEDRLRLATDAATSDGGTLRKATDVCSGRPG